MYSNNDKYVIYEDVFYYLDVSIDTLENIYGFKAQSSVLQKIKTMYIWA